MSDILCKGLGALLGEAFACRPHQRHVIVRTPFAFPDGEAVELYVVVREERFDVTDFGAALGWLRIALSPEWDAPAREAAAGEACRELDVTVRKGQLVRGCTEITELAECVLRVGEAAVRVTGR